MEKKVLRKYLEQIRLLEVDLYTLDRTVSLLKNEKRELPRKRTLTMPVKAQLQEPKLEDFKRSAVSKSSGIGAGVGLIFGPTGVAAGYAIGKIVDKKNQNKEYKAAIEAYKQQLQLTQQTYAAEMKQYEKDVQDENSRYEREMQSAYRFNSSLNYQIAQINSIISAIRSDLDRMYGLGIIYSKYRSLIPISRFCEYLDSGRRTELEGQNGMYELYEQELLGNQIVNGLHTVNDNLDKMSTQLDRISSQLSYGLSAIQNNQILLYQEVTNSNNIAGEVASEMKHMAEQFNQHISSIDQSAKLTALNAQITARRTEAIANIVEYEHAKESSLTV